MMADRLTNSHRPLSRFDAVGDDQMAAIRECLGKLSFAFTDLLGVDQGTPEKLEELSAIAHEVGDLCAWQARRRRVVDAPPDQPL